MAAAYLITLALGALFEPGDGAARRAETLAPEPVPASAIPEPGG